MLLNLSNHPSVNWPKEQLTAAIEKYNSVEDLAFPKINPEWDSDDVEKLVEEYEIKVRKIDPTAVHIMGEMTFTFRLVNKLKAVGYSCVASTTERIAHEDEQGNKVSSFRFVHFRQY